MSWPPARRPVVEVENDGHRPWDDDSLALIEVVQTVPPFIADLALPVIRDDHVSTALRTADAAVAQLSNRAIQAGLPRLGHLVAVLVRSDAVASSQIEHVQTSSEALAVELADLDEDGDAIAPSEARGTRLVAGAVEAVQAALNTQGPEASEQWLKDLHRELLRSDLEILPKHLGEWRDCPVWIGPTRQHAEFEGPPHELIPELIADLLAFAARNDVPTIAQAAIAHAQFETIHPFVDGNGRIGRALIHSLIGTSNVPVPVAHGLLSDLAGYIEGLTAYRDGDVGTWLATFCAAVERGAIAAVGLIGSLQNLQAHFHQVVPTRAGSATRQLIDDLIAQPVVTSLTIQRQYGVSAPRASQLTAQLEGAGILRRSTLWAPTSRKVWVAPDVLTTIDAIGERMPRTA